MRTMRDVSVVLRGTAVLAILISALLVLSPLTVASAQSEKETIEIGVLVDLSGPLTTYGMNIRNTMMIAEEDINSYFEEKGLPYEVKFYYEDTKVNANIALEKIQSLYSRGVKLIVGPMASGEVAHVKNYVTSNKIIIVSPSSTALPSLLGITTPEEKKYIFRFVGTDDLQTDAIAGEIKSYGMKAVVITYIGNAWGKGLYETIKPKLEANGIEVVGYVEYPDNPIPADFSPYISELEGLVKDALERYSNAEVGVVAFSYEEVATMLAQTPESSPLLNILWFGCDGTAKSSKVLEDAPEKAKRIALLSTLFESQGPGIEQLRAKFEQKGLSGEPYQYAMNAYDAAWVLALSYVEVVEEKGSYDPDAMAEKIPEVTKKYSEGEYGVEPVSGYIELNEWNDRATGDYAIWYVSPEGQWEKAGTWHFSDGSVEWISKPSVPQVQVTEKETPGFEALFGVLALLTVSLVLRRLWS
ncbi:MAG: branched-chain amino acid transport system substrate-binding protein [Archaeoglobi archaeon]|nr:branched-chain amino acid transport system substrate-binding protein [Archaeoglobi archaeon]MDK2781265.1 branched-chain amino acid transport system substrate-binding protein [Archaeoglobi archaeon]